MKIPRLLLCEDDPWERNNHPECIKELWKELFNEAIDIHSCSDIEDDEAPQAPSMSAAHVGDYDALLLDVWWGDSEQGGTPHGVEIAEKVRRRYPELPIIIMSGKVRL